MSQLFKEEKYYMKYCPFTDKLIVTFRGISESVFVSLMLANMNKVLTKEEEMSNALNYLLNKRK